MRFALFFTVSVALGMAAVTVAATVGGKNSLWHMLGVSDAKAGPALADASCTLPSKDTAEDIYFVSCGGFF